MSQTTNLNGLTFDSIPRMSIFKNDDVIKFICDKEENTSIMIGKISKIDLDTNKLTFRYAWNINDKGEIMNNSTICNHSFEIQDDMVYANCVECALVKYICNVIK